MIIIILKLSNKIFCDSTFPLEEKMIKKMKFFEIQISTVVNRWQNSRQQKLEKKTDKFQCAHAAPLLFALTVLNGIKCSKLKARCHFDIIFDRHLFHACFF